eukprot:COSAG04_NODE_448_length_14230_cov_204.054985_2_plen_68_part_01
MDGRHGRVGEVRLRELSPVEPAMQVGGQVGAGGVCVVGGGGGGGPAPHAGAAAPAAAPCPARRRPAAR